MGTCPVMSGAQCRPLGERASRQWYNNRPRPQAMPGTLFVVATPIGNLEDITLRALRVLREADVDRRRGHAPDGATAEPLRDLDPDVSFHEHNSRSRLPQCVAAGSGEQIALVTDAGTPGVSDPGSNWSRRASRPGIPVDPIPGPAPR